jgi:predicted neutral ceramidase superfamily lipid hydrolase
MNWRTLIAVTPLMLLPLAAYNLFAALLPGGFRSHQAYEVLMRPLTQMTTASGGVWPICASDILVATGLVVLFVELVKSTSTHRMALINHGLSMLLFVICLLELLLTPAFATSTFFLLTLMVLLDVLAGFIVTVAALRRENSPPQVR